jgi:hypothetical protein
MADDLSMPEDSRTPQFGQASPQQLAQLKQRYQPAAKPAVADASGRPSTGTAPKKEVPYVGKEAAAKALQSATFGFGADIAGAISGKQMEQSIRQMEKSYDSAHPLASFGIDLAVAGAMSALPVLGAAKDAELAASGAKLAAKAALGGAAYGGLSGAGSGGDVGTRAEHALTAAIGGAAFGAGGAVAGKALVPFAEKIGLASSEKSAANAVISALKKEGKTPAELDAFLKANPDARIADFSPKVAEAVGKAGGLTNKSATAVGDVARSDKEAQLGRLTSEAENATPLQKSKQEMIDNIDKLRRQTKDTYTLSKTESVSVTPELQRILDHPEVRPLYDQAVRDFGAGKKAGIADLQAAPKMAVKGGQVQSIPSAMLDDLQKAVGKAAEDEGVGSIRYGTLSAAQRALKDQQTGNIVNAQKLAARLGGEESKSGVLGAQQWGHQYAFGLGSADIEAFRVMSSEQKEYARLGMLSGLEAYLHKHARMPEGALTGIADQMRAPMLTEVLGDKTANDVRKVFSKEAARARVTAEVERGGNRRAAFNEENQGRMLGHAANVVLSAGGHIIGTGVRLLTANGMSEKQAVNIVNIASQPGGFARLQSMGMDRRLIDRLAKTLSTKGVVPGAVGAQLNERAQQ